MIGNAQSSTAGMVPVGSTRGGKPRRRLVHTACLLPDAPSTAGRQGSDQAAADLEPLRAGRQPSDRSQMPAVQAQGMSTIAARTYSADLLVQNQQAQQQPSSQHSAIQHQYAPDLAVSNQAQMTQSGSLGPAGRTDMPNLMGSSTQTELKQSVSPPVSSQTTDFSRFNLSAMPSSRKRSASQTPPDQQADPGAGQGSSGMFDFVRTKAKKLQGGTPGSSMSSSSIFGTRHTSPASGIFCRTANKSSSPSLLSRLSESQFTSRSLAPTPQDPRQKPQPQGWQQPSAQPLAQTVARHAQPEVNQPVTSLLGRSEAPVDWSHYLDDSTMSDLSDAPGMPDSEPPRFGGPVNMFDQPWCDTEQPDMHSMGLSKLQRRSPMDAKLQPLIVSPLGGQASRLVQQHQGRGLVLSDGHYSRPVQQQTFQGNALSGLQPDSVLSQQQGQGDILRRDAQTSEPSGSMMTGSRGSRSGRRLLVQPMASATNPAEPSRSLPSNTQRDSGAANRTATVPSADKENAQQTGFKAPVRKALFGSHGNSEEQSPAATVLPPLPSHRVVDSADVPSVFMPSSQVQTAVPVKPAEASLQGAVHKPVDFSSVFDFL